MEAMYEFPASLLWNLGASLQLVTCATFFM